MPRSATFGEAASLPPGAAATWQPVLDALAGAGRAPVSFEPLAGDVSARRYGRLRLASGEWRVVCAYPDDMEEVAARFLAATELLDSVAVPTPKVDCHSLERPVWVLLEDVGPCTLFESWQEAGGGAERNLDRRLTEARELVRRIQRLPLGKVRALGSPPLDRDLLMAELERTWERFLVPQGLVADPGLARELRATCAALCERLGSAAAVPCHRDFMARNLMPRRSAAIPPGDGGGLGELVVIDHQDLRPGPPCYDLASLLNDSLTLSPRERQRHLADIREDAERMVQYHAAAAQRALKIVGTFAHFATVRSDRYLRLIPLALQRFLDALEALPEGRDPLPRLRQALLSSFPGG